MSVSSTHSLAVVPACKPELPTDALREVISYLSPKELLRCSAVNQEWRAEVNEALEQLENPRDIKGPIYTRTEFLERLRNAIARIEPGQELQLSVSQFSRRNTLRPLIEYSCSVDMNNRSLLSRLLSRKRAIVMNVHLDEVNNPTDANPNDSGLSSGRYDSDRATTIINSRTSFAPTSLFQEIDNIAFRGSLQLAHTLPDERPRSLVTTAASIALIAVTLTGLYKFMNTTDSSIRDL